MEKKVYCSPGALLGLTRMIEHPLRMVKDLAEREVLCKRFYNELVSALNQIDRRTMTSVFYDLCKNSLALSDAQASVQRSYSDQSKSVKRERELSPLTRFELLLLLVGERERSGVRTLEIFPQKELELLHARGQLLTVVLVALQLVHLVQELLDLILLGRGGAL